MTEVRKTGNFETPGGRQILYWTILDLHRSITYFMAEENRAHVEKWELEEFAAAISLFAILGERYSFSVGVKASTVRHWQDVYFTLYDKRYGYSDDEPDLLRDNIGAAFARLEALAELRPPQQWGQG